MAGDRRKTKNLKKSFQNYFEFLEKRIDVVDAKKKSANEISCKSGRNKTPQKIQFAENPVSALFFCELNFPRIGFSAEFICAKTTRGPPRGPRDRPRIFENSE
jgi:hypothetical protein